MELLYLEFGPIFTIKKNISVTNYYLLGKLNAVNLVTIAQKARNAVSKDWN